MVLDPQSKSAGISFNLDLQVLVLLFMADEKLTETYRSDRPEADAKLASADAKCSTISLQAASSFAPHSKRVG